MLADGLLPPIAVNLFTTEQGPVMHGSLSREVTVDLAGDAVNEDGHPYAVVHQYDRFAELEAQVALRYPIDGSLPPFNLTSADLVAFHSHDLASTTDKSVHIG